MKTSSFPFLSGNTFRKLCDYELTHNFSDFFKSQSYYDVVFISVKNFWTLIEWLKENRNVKQRNETLVIHNGDVIPDYFDYIFVTNYFNKMHSVNWIEETSQIKSLPVGLENLSYVKNGVPSDYILDSDSKSNWSTRPIDLLVAFSDSTNPKERLQARKFSKDIDNVFIAEEVLKPKQFRELIKKSKFVLSPPGNGLDCHRTWETIYLGAVPIVLRKAWSFTQLNQNVFVLDRWENLSSFHTFNGTPLRNPITTLFDLFLKKFSK